MSKCTTRLPFRALVEECPLGILLRVEQIYFLFIAEHTGRSWNLVDWFFAFQNQAVELKT